MSSSEEGKMLEQVCHFFESQSFRFDTFIVKSSFKGNRAGFMDESLNKPTSGDYYVFVKTFKQELCKGFEPKAIEQLLLKKSLLKLNAVGKIGEPIWVPSCEKSMRLYHFSSSILGEKARTH